jgi:SAM-dependent methyltransferase
MTSLAEKTYSNRENARLLDLLPQGRRLLDCGCGAGNNARVLSPRGWTVTGITISPKEAELAAEHCTKIIVADLEDGLPPLSDLYDVVLLSHVLEHLAHPARLLNAIKSRLAPGGTLAVALPNVANWHVRLALLRGRFDYVDTGIMDESHLKFYTLETGKLLLTRNGFDVTLALGDGWLPIGRMRRLIPERMLPRVDRWVSMLWPGPIAFQNIYLARLP